MRTRTINPQVPRRRNNVVGLDVLRLLRRAEQVEHFL